MSPGFSQGSEKSPTQHDQDNHHWNPLIQVVVEHEEKSQMIPGLKKAKTKYFKVKTKYSADNN